MDLSQIQNLSLHHPAIVETPILDDVPIDVRLAVLAPSSLPQKHDGTNRDAETRPKVFTTAHSSNPRQYEPHQFNCVLARAALKIAFLRSQSAKSG
jgi:hypothetical protein